MQPAPITAFPVTSTVTYSSTGAVATDFNLVSLSVAHAGEVAAFIDGVLHNKLRLYYL